MNCLTCSNPKLSTTTFVPIIPTQHWHRHRPLRLRSCPTLLPASLHFHTPAYLSFSPRSSTADPPANLPNDPPSAETPPGEVTDLKNFWKNWQTNAAQLRAQVAKLGLAAILAYGLFDGVTYTTFFILAFLGYEKSTGKNPATNIQALLGIVILMWTGNNVTRPFRVAGAAALAPFIDKALKKLQQALKLPNQIFAFMLVVATFAAMCASVVGLLILSRWGK